MTSKKRTRFGWLTALAVSLTMLVPMAAGSQTGSGDSSVILLSLGNRDQVTWMGATQAISSRKCVATVAASPQILTITPTGGELGLVKGGLGVRSASDGNGDPCGRVEADDSEAITVSLGSHVDGHLISAIDVDVELKFNAVVEITFKRDGTTVHTMTFTGTGSDDGPDSGDGDNYRFFARPTSGGSPILFDEVVFRPTAGAMSLEGGADGTEKGTLDPNSNASQFQVVKTFDGQITCGKTVVVAESGIPQVRGDVTMHALKMGSGGWAANCTQLKNYNDDVTPSSLFFLPVLENSQARYTLQLKLENQPITTDSNGQITSLVMRYTDGQVGSVGRPLRPCQRQPDFTAAFFQQASTGLLQANEFACFYNVVSTPTGPGVGTEVWSIYFEDDPGFLF